ncbi:hypothetical protein BpHYR1_019595 [Brachionus plicatilis]|uniref:Uncharacterized protein n=1 Tax=Brachionus plicatilis TaxID=10195 RepID=A0A3M7SHU9_BRAPC|nr:hypothetical protein BpHYR1_019595 [Brachionus plicatilis]
MVKNCFFNTKMTASINFDQKARLEHNMRYFAQVKPTFVLERNFGSTNSWPPDKNLVAQLFLAGLLGGPKL